MSAKRMSAQEIRKLIEEGRLDIFYTSGGWKEEAAEARRRQNDECQRCKAKGLYVPCRIVHHRQYLRVRPDLAYDQDNLECLCWDCHEEEHPGSRRGDDREVGYQNEERW